jgi:predicted ester cyclase
VKTTTTADLNKSIALEFYDACARGDLDECRRLLSPDVRVYNTGLAGSPTREQLLQLARTFLAAFSDHAIRFTHQVSEGEWVSSWGRYRATHTGHFHGLLATGRTIEIPVCVLDRVVNAEIVEHHGAFDALALMQQLGALPLPVH